MAVKIQLRRGTSSEWAAVQSTVVLSSGEIGVNTTTNQIKVGNGSSTWESLPYFASGTITAVTPGDGITSGSGGSSGSVAIAVDPNVVMFRNVVNARGDIMTATANDAPTTLSLGTNSYVLKSDVANVGNSTGLVWGQVSTDSIADDSVTTIKIPDSNITAAKLAANSVTTVKILDGAITSAKIADGTIATADIADGAVTSAKLADGAVTSAKISDGTIATGDIADSAVTSAKIANDTIVNGDINSAAGIAASKLAGVFTTASGANRSITISTGTPTSSDGSDGDVWFKY